MSADAVTAFLSDIETFLEARPDLAEAGSIGLFPAQHHFGVMPENTGDIDLDALAAERPGEGWGSKIMQVVVDLADRHGLKIYVRAHADSEDDETLPDMQGALESFYQRFGFADTGSWGARDMLRRPQAPTPDSEARLEAAHLRPASPAP
ncbi:GNAT family N-acetyltransferase [Bosea sp. RAC05]|uniref:GNAT family N-acetyltransferase n=1 Tax=Bosea sp. RAC05 TaxID=1842539 RepID=UPI00083CC534|nr:GNAT family N-acetyltransferase [Bosea sp. RAC05]AOG03233.1 hypothetical protein BSY19_5056 [Bosea sp. RAC05]